MKVVEVVMGRSVTFHQGTCLSGLSTLPSGVVLFHHDEGVNCLCVSDLMCYVLILMLVNLLSLFKRTTVSHRLLRPMGERRCPAAASEPTVRGPPVCDWFFSAAATQMAAVGEVEDDDQRNCYKIRRSHRLR